MISSIRSPQRAFSIGGVEIGGLPGERPAVLIGSIFHKGHKIVKDPRKGEFDRAEAERLINLQEEWSDKTGIPHMIDVVGETSEALVRYLEFVASITDVPLLMNGPTAEVRVTALRLVTEIGLIDRVIYNSINYTVKEEELRAIKNSGVEAAIIQTFNPRNPWPEGSLKMALGEGYKQGLLQLALKYGIRKPLLLPPVLDIPSIGLAIESISLLKDKLGFPVGVAPCGVIGQHPRIKELPLSTRRCCEAAVVATARIAGADFIIYGSIGKASKIFPACAVVESFIAYAMRRHGIRPLRPKNHPLYRFLVSR